MLRRSMQFIARCQRRITSHRDAGLFGVDGLDSPEAFPRLATAAIVKCNALIALLSNSIPSLHSLPIIDNMSEAACRIADVAELCRHTHPQEVWRNAAQVAHLQMVAYLTELNTSPVVFAHLVRLADNPLMVGSLSSEQRRFTTLLLGELRRNGSGFQQDAQSIIRASAMQIVNLESSFYSNLLLPTPPIHLSADAKEAIPSSTRTETGTGIVVRNHPAVSDFLLRTVADASVRKEIFIRSNQVAPENLDILQQLVMARHAHALHLGFPSFSQMQLADMMCKNTYRVQTFLEDLSARLRSKSLQEFQMLSAAKLAHVGRSDISPWDIPFYRDHILRSMYPEKPVRFRLDRTFEVLDLIAEKLFGCRLVFCDAIATSPLHCAWPNESLNQLNVLDSDNVLVGTIFLDFHARANKFTSAAQFAIKSGFAGSVPSLAVVCSILPAAQTASIPFTINHSHLVTLFHEMGHALHSIFSRTTFQHLAGTRGPFDFVEIPSHLMEQFAWDPRVLELIAPPRTDISSIIASRSTFAAMDMQTQIVHSLLDQALFNEPSDLSSIQLLETIQNCHSRVQFVKNTHEHTTLSHLCGYGASYFSYLYARMLASFIWHEWFAVDPLSANAGRRFRAEFLALGNAHDPLDVINAIVHHRRHEQIPSIDKFVEREVE